MTGRFRRSFGIAFSHQPCGRPPSSKQSNLRFGNDVLTLRHRLVGHLEHTQGAASGKLEKEYQDFEEILLVSHDSYRIHLIEAILTMRPQGLKKVNPPPVIHVHHAPAPTTAPVFPKVGAHSWVAGSRLPGTGSGQFLFGMSIRVAASPTSPSGYGHGF